MSQNINYKVFEFEMKQNVKREQNFCERYRKSLKKTRIRHNKFIQDSKKEISKIYNIEALW